MALNINGSTGISGVAGTAGSPVISGISTGIGFNFENEQLNVGIGTNNKVIFDIAGNINALGIITATTFDGNATTATTAQGLTGTPGLDVGLTTVTGLDGVAYVAITTTSVSKTIVNREYVTVIGIGTAAGITITLPASPTAGHEVGVAVAGTFTDTVIARNNSNIMTLAENMTLDRAYISVQLVYVDSSVGWRFF